MIIEIQYSIPSVEYTAVREAENWNDQQWGEYRRRLKQGDVIQVWTNMDDRLWDTENDCLKDVIGNPNIALLVLPGYINTELGQQLMEGHVDDLTGETLSERRRYFQISHVKAKIRKDANGKDLQYAKLDELDLPQMIKDRKV